MLVGAAAPFLGSERAKERVRMASTFGFAALMELLDLGAEPLLFLEEITGIRANEFFGGGAVFGEGLFVGVDRLDERAEDAANEGAREIELTTGHVDGGRAMGEHLGDVHLSPLGGSVGLKFIDAGDDFVGGVAIEEVFHGDLVGDCSTECGM